MREVPAGLEEDLAKEASKTGGRMAEQTQRRLMPEQQGTLGGPEEETELEVEGDYLLVNRTKAEGAGTSVETGCFAVSAAASNVISAPIACHPSKTASPLWRPQPGVTSSSSYSSASSSSSPAPAPSSCLLPFSALADARRADAAAVAPSAGFVGQALREEDVLQKKREALLLTSNRAATTASSSVTRTVSGVVTPQLPRTQFSSAVSPVFTSLPLLRSAPPGMVVATTKKNDDSLSSFSPQILSLSPELQQQGLIITHKQQQPNEEEDCLDSEAKKEGGVAISELPLMMKVGTVAMEEAERASLEPKEKASTRMLVLTGCRGAGNSRGASSASFNKKDETVSAFSSLSHQLPPSSSFAPAAGCSTTLSEDKRSGRGGEESGKGSEESGRGRGESEGGEAGGGRGSEEGEEGETGGGRGSEEGGEEGGEAVQREGGEAVQRGGGEAVQGGGGRTRRGGEGGGVGKSDIHAADGEVLQQQLSTERRTALLTSSFAGSQLQQSGDEGGMTQQKKHGQRQPGGRGHPLLHAREQQLLLRNSALTGKSTDQESGSRSCSSDKDGQQQLQQHAAPAAVAAAARVLAREDGKSPRATRPAGCDQGGWAQQQRAAVGEVADTEQKSRRSKSTKDEDCYCSFSDAAPASTVDATTTAAAPPSEAGTRETGIGSLTHTKTGALLQTPAQPHSATPRPLTSAATVAAAGSGAPAFSAMEKKGEALCFTSSAVVSSFLPPARPENTNKHPQAQQQQRQQQQQQHVRALRLRQQQQQGMQQLQQQQKQQRESSRPQRDVLKLQQQVLSRPQQPQLQPRDGGGANKQQQRLAPGIQLHTQRNEKPEELPPLHASPKSKYLDSVIQQGWLLKWTNLVSSWRPRYFYVLPGLFKYCVQKRAPPKEVFMLNQCVIRLCPHDPVRFEVEVIDQQTLYLRTETLEEKQLWYAAFKQAQRALVGCSAGARQSLRYPSSVSGALSAASSSSAAAATAGAPQRRMQQRQPHATEAKPAGAPSRSEDPRTLSASCGPSLKSDDNSSSTSSTSIKGRSEQQQHQQQQERGGGKGVGGGALAKKQSLAKKGVPSFPSSVGVVVRGDSATPQQQSLATTPIIEKKTSGASFSPPSAEPSPHFFSGSHHPKHSSNIKNTTTLSTTSSNSNNSISSTSMSSNSSSSLSGALADAVSSGVSYAAAFATTKLRQSLLLSSSCPSTNAPTSSSFPSTTKSVRKKSATSGPVVESASASLSGPQMVEEEQPPTSGAGSSSSSSTTTSSSTSNNSGNSSNIVGSSAAFSTAVVTTGAHPAGGNGGLSKKWGSAEEEEAAGVAMSDVSSSVLVVGAAGSLGGGGPPPPDAAVCDGDWATAATEEEQLVRTESSGDGSVQGLLSVDAKECSPLVLLLEHVIAARQQVQAYNSDIRALSSNALKEAGCNNTMGSTPAQALRKHIISLLQKVDFLQSVVERHFSVTEALLAEESSQRRQLEKSLRSMAKENYKLEKTQQWLLVLLRSNGVSGLETRQRQTVESEDGKAARMEDRVEEDHEKAGRSDFSVFQAKSLEALAAAAKKRGGVPLSPFLVATEKTSAIDESGLSHGDSKRLEPPFHEGSPLQTEKISRPSVSTFSTAVKTTRKGGPAVVDVLLLGSSSDEAEDDDETEFFECEDEESYRPYDPSLNRLSETQLDSSDNCQNDRAKLLHTCAVEEVSTGSNFNADSPCSSKILAERGGGTTERSCFVEPTEETTEKYRAHAAPQPDQRKKTALVPAVSPAFQALSLLLPVTKKFSVLQFLEASVGRIGAALTNHRTALPKPRTEFKVGLWSILKDCIGKDLSRISLPVYFNEPTSFLQRLLEDFQYADLLYAAPLFSESVDRMLLMTLFATTPYASATGRTYKPFNPLLGETYEFVHRGYRFIAEQVGHHPPRTAYHVENERMKCWGDVAVRNRFTGKSLEVTMPGTAHVLLPSVADHFTYRRTKLLVHNVIWGRLWAELDGTTLIQNQTKGDYSIIQFVRKGWLDKSMHMVRGLVFTAAGLPVYRLTGSWSHALYCEELIHSPEQLHQLEQRLKLQPVQYRQCYGGAKDTGFACLMPGAALKNYWRSDGPPPSDSPDNILQQILDGFWDAFSVKEHSRRLIWKPAVRPPHSDIFYGFGYLTMELNEIAAEYSPEKGAVIPATDSRFRPDQRLYEEGRVDEAVQEKTRLEEKQRAAARLRLNGEEEYEASWFVKGKDEITHEPAWLYKSGYWEAKDRLDGYAGSPSIF